MKSLKQPSTKQLPLAVSLAVQLLFPVCSSAASSWLMSGTSEVRISNEAHSQSGVGQMSAVASNQKSGSNSWTANWTAVGLAWGNLGHGTVGAGSASANHAFYLEAYWGDASGQTTDTASPVTFTSTFTWMGDATAGSGTAPLSGSANASLTFGDEWSDANIIPGYSTAGAISATVPNDSHAAGSWGLGGTTSSNGPDGRNYTYNIQGIRTRYKVTTPQLLVNDVNIGVDTSSVYLSAAYLGTGGGFYWVDTDETAALSLSCNGGWASGSGFYDMNVSFR